MKKYLPRTPIEKTVAAVLIQTIVILAVAILMEGCAFTSRKVTTSIGKDGSTNIVERTKRELNSDRIVSIKQRSFGIVIGQSPTTQTPEIHLGLVSTVVQFTPVRTNALFAPKYADTFEITQGINPFGFAVKENTGAGDVATGTNAATTAIVPGMPAGQSK